MLRKVGQVTYEVDMLDWTKDFPCEHAAEVGLHQLPVIGMMLSQHQSQRRTMSFCGRNGQSGQSLLFGPERVDEVRRELLHLLDEFADVLQNKPGRTTLTEHTYH